MSVPVTGGGILVVESLLDADGRGPLTTQLYSLNMLVQTEGRERTPAQYHALLAAAGFRDIRCQTTWGVYGAILARKGCHPPPPHRPVPAGGSQTAL